MWATCSWAVILKFKCIQIVKKIFIQIFTEVRFVNSVRNDSINPMKPRVEQSRFWTFSWLEIPQMFGGNNNVALVLTAQLFRQVVFSKIFQLFNCRLDWELNFCHCCKRILKLTVFRRVSLHDNFWVIYFICWKAIVQRESKKRQKGKNSNRWLEHFQPRSTAKNCQLPSGGEFQHHL